MDKNVRTQDVLPGDLRQIVRNIVLISKATPGDDEFVLWLAPRLEAAGYTVFADILNLEGGTRLVNDRMRLACGSPSNRSSMKRWTSPEQRVWFRLIVWPRESCNIRGDSQFGGSGQPINDVRGTRIHKSLP